MAKSKPINDRVIGIAPMAKLHGQSKHKTAANSAAYKEPTSVLFLKAAHSPHPNAVASSCRRRA